jgi:hypothetical protein
LPGVAKRIAGGVTKNIPYACLVADTLENITKLFNSSLRCEGKEQPERADDIADAMRIVFDPTQKFY